MLSPDDARLVSFLHGGFPLSDRPFAEVAAQLGCSEDAVLDRRHELVGNPRPGEQTPRLVRPHPRESIAQHSRRQPDEQVLDKLLERRTNAADANRSTTMRSCSTSCNFRCWARCSSPARSPIRARRP